VNALPTRADYVAGLRELADFVEASDLPMPTYRMMLSGALSVSAGYELDNEASAAMVGRAAQMLDVDLVTRVSGADRHHTADRSFGPIELHLSFVEFGVVTDIALGGGEVADPDPSAGSATTRDVEHYHVRGTAGLPGENEAECACGVTYAGFDTHAEAVAALDQHITAVDSPAGPAASVDDPSGDAVQKDSRPQDRPGPAAVSVSVPVATGDGAAVTPDVWVARRRRGIHYHACDVQAHDRFTACGRSARPNGNRVPLTEAEAFGAVPCPRCYGGAA
jgi:hypothetical protein